MATRVPQDVDLEDRLVFGLTPTRFGYLVIGGLAAFMVWSLHWAVSPVRLLAAAPLGAAGIALAWGRCAGRGIDGWVGDFARYLAANVRLEGADDQPRESGGHALPVRQPLARRRNRRPPPGAPVTRPTRVHVPAPRSGPVPAATPPSQRSPTSDAPVEVQPSPRRDAPSTSPPNLEATAPRRER